MIENLTAGEQLYKQASDMISDGEILKMRAEKAIANEKPPDDFKDRLRDAIDRLGR